MFENWLRQVAAYGSGEGVRPKPTQWGRLQLETMEDRLVPAHLNPGVGEVLLPPAAAHGEHGIATASDAPASHLRSKMIILD